MDGRKADDLRKLDGLDKMIEDGLKEWRAPGMAISIVKDGELLYSKGYGYRDPEKQLAMDADTLYRIASNTKAFTALSLAILVDEGKLEWDKPVRHYIPYFRLKDTYATENVTPRDLLSHRTGLPGHDWALHHLKTRKERVEHLRYLDASYPIRTKQQYNNIMFMTAGHLVECITGQSWESFVQERIFNALEMEKSNFSFYKSRLSGNYAECFYLKDDEVRQFKHYNETDSEAIYPGSPAGGINTSANEIANWMIMQLNKGEFKGKKIASEKAFYEMHSPQMTDNWDSPYEEYGESSCGLGWFIWAYRGQKLAVHGGFFGSQVYLMPKRGIGVTVMPTLHLPFTDVVLCNIFDRLLGLDQIDWNSRRLKEVEEQKKQRKPAVSDQKAGTSPSHALEDYCGEYTHPAYGKFVIKAKGAGLVIEDEERKNLLRHYHYDTFEVLDEDGEVAFKLSFQTDVSGMVSCITAKLESSVKDIIFKRGA